MRNLRRFGLTAAVGAALTLGLITAPVAAAAPVPATTLSPAVGSAGGTGSAGSGGALVEESVRVSVDPETPGVSLFGRSYWSSSVVEWTNLSEGTRGTVHLPRQAMVEPPAQVSVETGSGEVVAVVRIEGVTFVPGTGSWTVP